MALGSEVALSHSLTFGSIALLAFWTVLVAELVGDKSRCTLTSLTLRFRAGLVFSAFALASGAKMLVARVLLAAPCSIALSRHVHRECRGVLHFRRSHLDGRTTHRF
jgi:hypothetical protein